MLLFADDAKCSFPISSQSDCSLLQNDLDVLTVWSQLIYGTQVWRPHLLKDIDALEAIQCRSTKFILNDYTFDYKSRLLSLQLLPLMMLYELNDILFFVKWLKEPNTSFTFSSNCTRSASTTNLFTNLRELMLPRTHISIDSHVCGTLSPSVERSPPYRTQPQFHVNQTQSQTIILESFCKKL